jgi:hypothetical protein
MGIKTKQATNFLMYSALAEIQLSMYKNTSLLVHFDSDLLTKHKNLKASFERVSKKAHKLFNEQEQLIFFDMINLFEYLIELSGNTDKFTQLMDLIRAHKRNEITVLNSTQELIDTAELAKNKK